MLPLLHDHVRRLTELLKASTEALRAYTASHVDMANLAIGFLDRTCETYRELGFAENENEMLTLKAQVSSIQNGFHPVTLERITRHRRSVERTIAAHALQTASSRLRTDIAQRQTVIDDARERLIPIVSVALQKGLLPVSDDGDPSQQELEEMWRAVSADPDLQAACQQLVMKMSVFDLLILLGDLLIRVQQMTSPQPWRATGIPSPGRSTPTAKLPQQTARDT